MRSNIEAHQVSWRRAVTVLALLALCFSASPAAAQTATCVAATDSTSLRLRSYLRTLVTGSDQSSVTVRATLAITTMDSTKVVVMADTRICPKILAGVNAGFQTPNVNRRLRVYSLGKNFAAFDSTVVDHAGGSVVILDSRYVVNKIIAAPSVY
jgi:hypothetical protein